MGGLNTIQHSSSARRQFKFFTSPSMLCATCGGGIVVLNFLMLCIFFLPNCFTCIFPIFICAMWNCFCVLFLFSPKLLQLHLPNFKSRNVILFLCSPVTRSLNAELGLLLPSTRQYLRWNLSTRKYFKLFLSWSYKIELIGICKIAHYLWFLRKG